MRLSDARRRLRLCLALPAALAAGAAVFSCSGGKGAAPAGSERFSERRLADSLREGHTAWARSYSETALRHTADADSQMLVRLCLADVALAEAQPEEALRLWESCERELRGADDSPLHRYLRIKGLKVQSVYYALFRADTDSLLLACRQALALAEGYPDVALRVVCLSNLGDAFRQAGKPAQAALCYRRSLFLADSARLPAREYVSLYQGLATTLTTLHDFAESTRWWDKARALAPEMTREERFNYYNNRGNDYYYRGDYDSCRLMFLSLDSLLDTYPSTEWERQFCRTNLVDVDLRLGRTAEARRLLGPAIAFFRSVGAETPLHHLRTQQINLARLEGNPGEALGLARRHPLPEGSKPEQQLLRLEALGKAQAAAGRWADAFMALKRYHAISDSVAGWRVRERVEMDRMAHERDTTLIHQRLELRVARSRATAAWGWLAVAALLLVAATTALIAHRRRARGRERRLFADIVALRMENVRQRITPHFIGNALNHEVLAHREGRPSTLPTLSALLRQGQALADELSIPLAAELRFIDFYVQVEGEGIGPAFRYEQRIAPGIDTEAVSVPSMTVQIVVENALKHGLRGHDFGPGERPLLLISVERQREGTLVEVVNNGRPYRAPEPGGATGTGLRVIRQTLLLLNEQNARPMTFELGPTARTGELRTRAALFIPDGYRFDLPALSGGAAMRGGASAKKRNLKKRHKWNWLPSRK